MATSSQISNPLIFVDTASGNEYCTTGKRVLLARDKTTDREAWYGRLGRARNSVRSIVYDHPSKGNERPSILDDILLTTYFESRVMKTSEDWRTKALYPLALQLHSEKYGEGPGENPLETLNQASGRVSKNMLPAVKTSFEQEGGRFMSDEQLRYICKELELSLHYKRTPSFWAWLRGPKEKSIVESSRGRKILGSLSGVGGVRKKRHISSTETPTLNPTPNPPTLPRPWEVDPQSMLQHCIDDIMKQLQVERRVFYNRTGLFGMDRRSWICRKICLDKLKTELATIVEQKDNVLHPIMSKRLNYLTDNEKRSWDTQSREDRKIAIRDLWIVISMANMETEAGTWGQMRRQEALKKFAGYLLRRHPEQLRKLEECLDNYEGALKDWEGRLPPPFQLTHES
ncbi:uncharacterized protein IWZ02DRAFT_485172 [Phyllosticta citriasiana]|uniref:uncharacterized protein n=1 Tax=Phyllosticta citriasiana TaxID=595635 RepID=UPI0030FD3B68